MTDGRVMQGKIKRIKMSDFPSYIPVEDWLQLHTVFTLYRDERLWQKVRDDLGDHLLEVINNLNSEKDKE